jgi:WD40 repeat protein
VLVSGGHDRCVRLWELSSDPRLMTQYYHDDKVDSIGISRDGRRVASGSQDRTVILYDRKPRRALTEEIERS